MQENTKQKKRRDIRIRLKNGIAFQPGIEMSVKRPVFSFFPLVQLLIAVISSLSVIYMLPAFLSWEGGKYEITNSATVFAVVLMTSLATLMSCAKEKFVKAVGIAFLLINAGYIVPHIKGVVGGFMFSVNAYTKRAGFPKPLFALQAADVTWGELELFLIAFAFIVTLMVSFGCIYHINFPLQFLATFPLFELGTFWGWEPYTWSMMGILFSWILVLAMSLINHSAKTRDPRNTFAVHVRKKTYYMTSERFKHGFFGLLTGAVVIVTTAVFITTTIYSLMADSVRPESFTKLRRDLSNGFRDVSQNISEKAQMMSDPLPGRSKMMGGTNGGRLGLYDKLTYTGKMAMRVATPEFSRRIYLRGYCGESYADNTWTPIANDQDCADFFDSHGALVLDYDYIQTIYNAGSESARTGIAIHPVNCSSDLFYAPYGSCYSQIEGAGEQQFDGMLSPVKKQQGEDYEIGAAMLAPEGVEWESILGDISERSANGAYYDGFAIYDERVTQGAAFYQLPEDTIPVLDSIIEGAGLAPGMSVTEVQELLRLYFTEQGYTYDLNPGVTPEGAEFVSYFLTQQKKGYCTYYASAGVMLMRRLGIPARYVEGYVIEPAQYSPDKNSITLTDRSAHAWCEVYIKGCGWYPLELTPGYEGENPNLTDEDKNIKKETRAPATVSEPKDSSKPESKPESKHESSAPDSSSKADKGESSSKGGDSSGKGSGNGSEGKNSSGKGSDSGRSPDSDAGFKIDRTQLTYLLLLVGFVAVVVITAEVRRKNSLERLEQLTHSEDDRLSVINCYTAFLRYAELLGVESGENLTDTKHSAKVAKKLKQELPELSSAFLELSDSAVLAYMSDLPVSSEDSARSRLTLNELRRRLYEMLRPLERFKAKWILGLY